MRVTTSGTQIENRLSELWSIFRFLNPGLLGCMAKNDSWPKLSSAAAKPLTSTRGQGAMRKASTEQ